MNLIQTFFNKSITNDNIDYTGGYNSTVVNWLSMAYSCLLLKQHNPNDNVVFYGNQNMVNLFADVFKLPYDEYHVVEPEEDLCEWFYCWPKILTYEAQQEAFIHIDSDIFMWESLQHEIKSAPLVAQHLEHDSTFYLNVYNQMQKDNICFPDFMKDCYCDGVINSYNAGLLGGHDLSFFKQYLWEIRRFINSNKLKISSSDRRFLYNVVFEQWLFFGLANKYDKPVVTFYKNPIYNFNMEDAAVTSQISTLKKLRYLHVMEYKRNIRCNRFITYKMRSEFPSVYEHILSVCKNKGIASSFYTDFSNDINANLSRLGFNDNLKAGTNSSNVECVEWKNFEAENFEMLKKYSNNRDEYIILHDTHNKLIERIRNNGLLLKSLNFEINPLLQVSEVAVSVLRKLLNKDFDVRTERLVLRLYNPIFNKIDKYVWTKHTFNLLVSLIKKNNIYDQILSPAEESQSMAQYKDLIIQSIFDGIVLLRL